MYLDLHDEHDIANKIYKGFLKEKRTKDEKMSRVYAHEKNRRKKKFLNFICMV